MSGMTGPLWIDVGAHEGEYTLRHALMQPNLTVYAFEPHPDTASALAKSAPKNYRVIDQAVSEIDGEVTFYVNEPCYCSSLLPLSHSADWADFIIKTSESRAITVRSVRLDTFMADKSIDRIDWLKIDAQGADLAVVKSLGARISDVTKITLEVDVAERPQYVGAPARGDVVHYLREHGFEVTYVEGQSDGLEQNMTFTRTRQVRIETLPVCPVCGSDAKKLKHDRYPVYFCAKCDDYTIPNMKPKAKEAKVAQ